MEGHPLQFHPTLKNECVIGVTCSNQSAFYLNLETSSSLCPELCMTGFGTDVKIEEMDLDSSKFEEHLYEKATIRSELEEAQQFSSLAAGTEQINETGAMDLKTSFRAQVDKCSDKIDVVKEGIDFQLHLFVRYLHQSFRRVTLMEHVPFVRMITWKEKDYGYCPALMHFKRPWGLKA